MSRYYQLIVFLSVYCIKNNCDQPSSHQLLCKNIVCSEPIGVVEATQNYVPDAAYKLRFNIGDHLDIYGFTENREYYIAKIGDTKGLVKTKFVRETRIFYKDGLILTTLDDSWRSIQPSIQDSTDVDDNFDSSLSDNNTQEVSSIVEPDPVTSETILVEEQSTKTRVEILGTTFYTNDNDEIYEPSSTVSIDQMKTPVTTTPILSEESISQSEQHQFSHMFSNNSFDNSVNTPFQDVNNTDKEIIHDSKLEPSTKNEYLPAASDKPSPESNLGYTTQGSFPSASQDNEHVGNLETSFKFNNIIENSDLKLERQYEQTSKVESAVESEKISPDRETVLQADHKKVESVESETLFLSKFNDVADEIPAPISKQESVPSVESVKPFPDIEPSVLQDSHIKSGPVESETFFSSESKNVADGIPTPISKQESVPSVESVKTFPDSEPSTLHDNHIKFGSAESETLFSSESNNVADKISTPIPAPQKQESLPLVASVKTIQHNDPSVLQSETSFTTKLNDSVDEIPTPITVYPNQESQSEVKVATHTDNSIPEQTHHSVSNDGHVEIITTTLTPEDAPISEGISKSSADHLKEHKTTIQPLNVEKNKTSDGIEEPVSFVAPPKESADSLYVGDQENSFNLNSDYEKIKSNSVLQSKQLNDPENMETPTESATSQPNLDLLFGILPNRPSFDLTKVNILVLVSLVWIIMYYTSLLFTSKESSLTKRLLDKEAKLFKVTAERDNLLVDLVTERDNYKSIHREYVKIKDKFHNMSVTMEHLKRENMDLVKKEEILRNENYKQKQQIKDLEERNGECQNELTIIFKEKSDVLHKFEDLGKELQAAKDRINELKSTLSDKNAEIESLKLENSELINELETTKSSNTILLSEKTNLEKSLEEIHKMKTDLDKKDQEIQSLKKLVADHLNTRADGWHESLDELLKSVELSAELEVTRNQLKDIFSERDALIAEKSELKTKFEKQQNDLLAANRARDEAVKNYQVLETYTRKTQTDLQMELGALKLKHDEIFKKNESVADYIASLESANKNYKEQIDDLKHQNEQDKHKRSQEYHSLETKFHMLYMDKVDIKNKLEAIKKENDLLRQRLNLKSQGKSDASLHQHSSGPCSPDSAPPPPPPPGYLDSTDLSLSHDSPPPPPPLPPPPPFPMGSWMNSSDLSVSGYGSLPPMPSTNYYPGPAYMARDTYSPTSHHSHDQRSERSALSHSSANNSRHYQNYGPTQVSGSVGPFSNPLPSHWYVNTNQSQNQHQPGTSTQNDNNRSYYNSGQ